MKTRIKIGKVQPAAYVAMHALDQYIDDTSIDRSLREILKIRASQINGCSYCVNTHTHAARELGIPIQKILLISVWKESGSIFTDEERLVLQMTEEITLIHIHGLSESTYEESIIAFGEEKTAEIIMAIICINGWNRIGVSTQLKFPKES
jgi:AhpD family alkylhydroperoxidase